VLKDMMPHEFPLILGWDVSGVISKVGDEVTDLKVGDEVYGYCRAPVIKEGTFAEYVCFEAQHIVKKPKNLSFAQAAGIPLVTLTAWQALFETGDVVEEQKVLIHAGAGGVGSMAIQLAKKVAGAFVVTTASGKNHEYVKSLGADEAIDYTKESFVEKGKEIAPEGFDFVFDCVGGETARESYPIVKPGGMVVSIVGAVDKAEAEGLGIRGGNVFVKPDGKQLQAICELIEREVLILPTVEERPFDEVVEALQSVKTQHTRGKIVLNIQ